MPDPGPDEALVERVAEAIPRVRLIGSWNGRVALARDILACSGIEERLRELEKERDHWKNFHDRRTRQKRAEIKVVDQLQRRLRRADELEAALKAWAELGPEDYTHPVQGQGGCPHCVAELRLLKAYRSEPGQGVGM